MIGTFAFESWELVILEQACRQRDTVADLDELIRENGLTTTGSTGQLVLHPAVTEARLGRAAIARLLGQLRLPNEDEIDTRPLTGAARRAQSAANHRWAQWRERRGEA